MRTASLKSSANEPRPEPNTSPICGRSLVCERMKAAADSARVKASAVIFRTHDRSAFYRMKPLRVWGRPCADGRVGTGDSPVRPERRRRVHRKHAPKRRAPTTLSQDLHNENPRRHRSPAPRNPRTLAKSRINTGPDKPPGLQLHNSRVTRLWTGCIRLMNKKLEVSEFD